MHIDHIISDACHSVHPMAGQGFNLGLADAECLARIIADAVEAGTDIGESESVCGTSYVMGCVCVCR